MIIFLWGAGFAAQELLESELQDVAVNAVIDNGKTAETWKGIKVLSPEEAVALKYDMVIVATGYAKEIYVQASNLGFDMDKFVFVYNNYVYRDMNTDYDLAGHVFCPRYIEVMKSRYHVIRGMMQDEIKQPILSEGDLLRHDGMYDSDYNRIRTFELIADEIKENRIEGNVAELGVFQGEFARYINKVFPEKKCYLFDTFEGFRKEEAITERDAGNCGNAFIERFRNTSIERVLKLMPFPEQIICRAGLFPESLNGLEDRFAFVSIDVDFEQAIYDGISYFYPRLTEGGYIFVHDYNSSTLRGVRKAILRYEKDYRTKIAKVPIPDVCGTLVITK